MVTYHPKDGHPPSKIKIYQNEVYYRHGIWHLDLLHKIKTRWQLSWMVIHHPKERYQWLPTIKNLTEGSIIQTWNLALNHRIKTRWQLSWMVSYHPLDGHPSFQGQGWSPSIPEMVTYQPEVGHPLSRITFPNIVAQLPKDGHPWSQAWSPTIQNYWNLIKSSNSN